MEIGFIGLGRMGREMARNLLRAGHRVTVFNRTRETARQLAGDGATVAGSIAEACRGEVLITMLADDAAVEAVAFGTGGVLAALGRDRLHVSMGTISVALAERLTAAHREAGQGFVAAPVFGRPEAAAAAKLFILAAGPAAAVVRCQPLFAAMGQRTFGFGETAAAASLVKLSGNFLIAAMLESLGEAFALIRKGGVDPQRYLELLTGSLFSAPVYKTYGTMIAAGTYEPVGFTMKLGLKDVRLALQAAEAELVPMPIASLLRDHFVAGMARGHAEADWSALARLCAEDAGL